MQIIAGSGALETSAVHFFYSFVYFFIYSYFYLFFLCIGAKLTKIIFAVWETDVSWHNGDPICGPLKPLNTIVLCDVRRISRGPSIGPPWCREMLVSRTTIRLINIFFQNGVGCFCQRYMIMWSILLWLCWAYHHVDHMIMIMSNIFWVLWPEWYLCIRWFIITEIAYHVFICRIIFFFVCRFLCTTRNYWVFTILHFLAPEFSGKRNYAQIWASWYGVMSLHQISSEWS